MSFMSNCPISGPARLDWKRSWDLGGGLAWSHEWGMFYDVSSAPEEAVTLRPPAPIGDR